MTLFFSRNNRSCSWQTLTVVNYLSGETESRIVSTFCSRGKNPFADLVLAFRIEQPSRLHFCKPSLGSSLLPCSSDDGAIGDMMVTTEVDK